MHFVSNVSIFSSSLFLMVQLSYPYAATGHTRAFMSLNLVVSFLLWLFHIFFNSAPVLIPFSSFPLTSLLHSTCSVISDPRFWNVSKSSNKLPFSTMLHMHIVSFSVIVLVLSMLISRPFHFQLGPDD